MVSGRNVAIDRGPGAMSVQRPVKSAVATDKKYNGKAVPRERIGRSKVQTLKARRSIVARWSQSRIERIARRPLPMPDTNSFAKKSRPIILIPLLGTLPTSSKTEDLGQILLPSVMQIRMSVVTPYSTKMSEHKVSMDSSMSIYPGNLIDSPQASRLSISLRQRLPCRCLV